MPGCRVRWICLDAPNGLSAGRTKPLPLHLLRPHEYSDDLHDPTAAIDRRENNQQTPVRTVGQRLANNNPKLVTYIWYHILQMLYFFV